MKYFIPFKYKLTSLTALIIVGLLMAIFTVVQEDIESRFRLLIDQRLAQAKGYVSQRMDDRYDLLFNDATAVVDDKLIRDVITDHTLSSLTRNDIVSAEVLPKFVHLEILAVTNPDGKLLAQQDELNLITQALVNGEWFGYATEGEPVGGYIFEQGRFYQGVAMPVFLGEEMIGIVVGARGLTDEDIAEIKQISDIDIMVLEDNKAIVASEFSGISTSKDIALAVDQWLLTEPAMNKDTFELMLGQERFLLQWVVDETAFVPPYIVVSSLDDSLLFVTNIRQTMILLGSLGIVIALVIAFMFAVTISSPIKRLSVATKKVAEEDFSHRVDIRSKDEFAHLGESFNRMIGELAEKQKIRSALDKSVSKQVADHMLEQGAKLGGTSEFATILFADIRGFTSLSETLDERSLINLLNQYFSQVNRCITSQNGVIDKFIGDAVMALFGTPIPCEQSAYSALMAARDMLRTVEVFNQQCRLIYGCDIHIGIGLNSGQVVAGMVGSEDRLNFTVLGDQVNIASRIEGLCKNYGVELILSESSVTEIYHSVEHWAEPIVFRTLDCVQVKGKSSGLKIYQPFFNPNEKERRYIEQFETALALVVSGQLEDALASLEQLKQWWADDQPTLLLYQACQAYLHQPELYCKTYVDGVKILTQK